MKYRIEIGHLEGGNFFEESPDFVKDEWLVTEDKEEFKAETEALIASGKYEIYYQDEKVIQLF